MAAETSNHEHSWTCRQAPDQGIHSASAAITPGYPQHHQRRRPRGRARSRLAGVVSPSDTKQVAEQLMAGVPQDVVDKVMWGNAIRMLSLDL